MKYNNSAQSYRSLMGSSSVFRFNNKLLINYCHTDVGLLYFSVNKKYGPAVLRNQFKRRVRMLCGDMFRRERISVALAIRPLVSNLSFADLSECFVCLSKTINKELA